MNARGPRAPSEIRASLWRSQARLDRDLEELENRIHENLSPKALVSRHPALFGIAGAALGIVLLRNPTALARGLSWMTRLATPIVIRTLLRRS